MARAWSKKRCDLWKKRIARVVRAGPGSMLRWVGEDVTGWKPPPRDTHRGWHVEPPRPPTSLHHVRSLDGKELGRVFPGDTMTLIGAVTVDDRPAHGNERGTRASAVVMFDGKLMVFGDVGGCIVLWRPERRDA